MQAEPTEKERLGAHIRQVLEQLNKRRDTKRGGRVTQPGGEITKVVQAPSIDPKKEERAKRGRS